MSIQTIKIPLQSVEYTPFIKEGDTIQEITFEFGATDVIDLTGATISMQLYQDGVQTLSIYSNFNGITIVSAKIFKLDEILNNTLPCGINKGDLQIEFADGTIQTLFNVEYTILKEYTITT